MPKESLTVDQVRALAAKLPGKRPRRKGPTPEGAVKLDCLRLLTLRRIWHMRLNTGAIKVGDRFIRFCDPGTGDIICTIGGQTIWIETKAGRNGQSNAQQAFQARVEAAGALYWLVRSERELAGKLDAYGRESKVVLA